MSGPRDRKDSSSFEDLFEELEEWDSTFDSLHEPTSEINLDELAESVEVEDDDAGENSKTVSKSASVDVRAAESEAGISSVSRSTSTAESVAAAQLDALTGDPEKPTRPPPIADAHEALEPADPFADDVGVDGGFGRPSVPLALPSRSSLLPAASVSRSSPAIVSRVELAKRRAAKAAEAAPTGDVTSAAKRELFAPAADFDDDPAQEWDRPSITNVMAKETVEKMVETASAFFNDQPEETLFELDGDFYDDIEIDESDEIDEIEPVVEIGVEAPPSVTARRRTMAHVVRRKTATEAQVPVYVDPAFGGPLAEVETAVRIDELALAESRNDAADVVDELAAQDSSVGDKPEEDKVSEPSSPWSDDGIDFAQPTGVGKTSDEAGTNERLEPDTAMAAIEPRPNFDAAADDDVLEAAGPAIVPVPTLVSPLANLLVDVPPQLPAPRLSSATVGLASVDPGVFANHDSLGVRDRFHGELLSLDDSVGDQLQDALLSMSLDTESADAMPEKMRQQAFARWASGLARYLGDVEDAHRYAEESKKGAPGSLAQLRRRELLASQGLWAEVIKELVADSSGTTDSSGGAATLAAELRLALGIVEDQDRDVPKADALSEPSGSNLDAAICLREFIAHARHLLGREGSVGATNDSMAALDKAGLAKRGRALAEMVADSELAVALRAVSMAADPTHSDEEIEALASSENPGISIEIWDLVAGSKLPLAKRAQLATSIAQTSTHATASTFHLIAAGLFAAAGDRANELASVDAATDDTSHPLVIRRLLSSSELPDDEQSDYLIAVASGTSAAPLAARALWRSSQALSGNKRREMLRRAVALDSTSRFLFSELEGLDAASVAADGSATNEGEDVEIEVSLALAPNVESGPAAVLNRLRARVDGIVEPAQLAIISGDPSARAVLEHPDLRFLARTHLIGAAEVARARLRAVRSPESASEPTVASEFCWRFQVVDQTLTRKARDASASNDEPGDRWRGLPPSTLIVSASAADRLSVRVALSALDSLEQRESMALAKASETWPLVGGRVGRIVYQVGAEVEHQKTAGSSDGKPLPPLMNGTLEMADPRLWWLSLWRHSCTGDWQAAATALSARGDDVSRYRAAHLLMEHGGDPTTASNIAEILVSASEPASARGVVFQSLADAALRTKASTADPDAEADDTDNTNRRTRAARASVAPSHDAFSAAIRDGEASEVEKDFSAAFACYQRALELRPGDPIAIHAVFWAAAASGEAKAAAAIALAELREAEDERDPVARADAYEALARLDAEVSGDEESSVLAWESAAETDPMRSAALRALERSYLRHAKNRELLVVYGRLLAIVDDPATEAALLAERARIAGLCERDPAEIARDYRAILELAPLERMPLFLIEQRAHLDPPSVFRADLLARAAAVLGGDTRSKAAFLCRSAEIRTAIGDYPGAIEAFKAATEVAPGHLPSLSGWREVAWRAEDWDSFATACELETQVCSEDSERASLFHLAGVAMMDKALNGPQATRLLKGAMALGGQAEAGALSGRSPEPYTDSFARLRLLFDEVGNDEALGDLLRMRLEIEKDPPVQLALHLELAKLCRNFWDDREGASAHLAAALAIEPNHHTAVAELSDISWELGAWDTAAETLLKRASLEQDPEKLKHIFYRLGTIYADHLPDPKWAIRCFTSSLTFDPDDTQALERLATLSRDVGDFKTALGASERLLKSGISNEEKVRHLHRVAEIQAARGAHGAAERAVRVAFDLAPHSKAALVAMVNFYQEAHDISSIRVNLDRAAQAMRARFAADREDEVALAVIARILTVRERAGVRGSERVGQVAAELARAIGEDSAEIAAIAAARPAARPRIGAMVGPEVDSILVSGKVPLELLHILRALRSRIGKFVSADPKRFGVGRGDRLKRGRHPVANLALEMATELGLRGVEVYVSSAALGAAIAVPTDPISIVLGSRFASLDRAAELTFALGRGLALGQLGLALVDVMTPADLDLLIAGIIRQFAPEYPGFGQTEKQLASEQHRLRRLFSSSLASELRHHALALTGLSLSPGSLHSAFRQVGLRAGLVATTNAAGALAATLRIGGYSTIQEAGEDPEVAELLRFSTSEEHVEIQAAIAEPPS